MLDPQETEIDGHEFQYHPMMLSPARKQFDELSQRFGPAIASAIEGLSGADIDRDMDAGAQLGGLTQSAGGLLRGLVAGLDPAYHKKLADALADKTLYRNTDGNYVPLDNAQREVMFGMNLLTEAKLIWWCLTVQYADFLGPLRDLSMQAIGFRSLTGSALASRKEQIGSPIGSPQATNTATA